MTTPAKKILILSDVHEKFKKWMRVLKEYSPQVDKIIQMGDYLDSYVHDEEEARQTATFIRDNIDNPKFDFGLGNHDTHYLWDDKDFSCSGWRADNKAIATHLLRPIRDKFKLVNWIAPDIMLSHAGLTKGWLNVFQGVKPGDNVKLRRITEQLQELWQNGGAHEKYAGTTAFRLVSQVGRTRGGWDQFGGITWCDFRTEFNHIPGLTQVMGHTRMKDAPHATPVDDSGHFSLMMDNDFNTVTIATYDEDTKSYRLEWHPFPSVPEDGPNS